MIYFVLSCPVRSNSLKINKNRNTASVSAEAVDTITDSRLQRVLTYSASSHTRTRSQPSGGSRWKEQEGAGEEEQACSRGVGGEGLGLSQSAGSAWRNIQSLTKTHLRNKLRLGASLRVQRSDLSLQWDRGSPTATEAMGREDTATEMGREAMAPGGPGRVHSGSHCCISGRGPAPCVHPGCPISGM